MEAVSIAIGVAGGLLSSAATIPYIIDTIRQQSKPRVTTWATWALLAGIAAAAAVVDRHWPAAIFAGVAAIASGMVALAGLSQGDRSFTKLDLACQIAALAGLGLWFVLKTPLVAVIAVIFVDFAGLVPTLRHSWVRPLEETPLTYLLIGAGAAVTVVGVLVGSDISAGSLAYPAYVAVSMGGCGFVIIARAGWALAPSGITRVRGRAV